MIHVPTPTVRKGGPAFLRGYVVFDDGKCETVTDLLSIDRRKESGVRYVWLDFKGCPDEATENALKAKLGWHPSVMQHFRIRSSRPRIDDYEGYTHVTLHALRSGFMPTDRRLTLELEVVVGSDYLVTIHETSTPPDVDEVYQKLTLSSPPIKSPDQLLHRLVTTMVDRYIPVVDAIESRLSHLEQEALYRANPPLLEKIVIARDEVLNLKHVLTPQVQILQEISDGDYAGFKPENRAYFRNSEQRLRHLLDDIAVYQEVARNALDLYQSSMTHRTNEIVRVLTVISIPLMVLSFLTGLYGMNVPIPLAGRHHAFVIICFLSALIFIGMLIYFKRRKWF